MALYRVWMAFDRAYVNPLTGRPGAWRVTDVFRSAEVGTPLRSAVLAWPDPPAPPTELGLLSLQQPARGSFVRPHKALNAYLQARKQTVREMEYDT